MSFSKKLVILSTMVTVMPGAALAHNGLEKPHMAFLHDALHLFQHPAVLLTLGFASVYGIVSWYKSQNGKSER